MERCMVWYGEVVKIIDFEKVGSININYIVVKFIMWFFYK